jgi:hypothetical protein
VIILESNDAFLRQRVRELPERAVFGTHNTETDFERRLKTFNELAEDGQAARFFEDVDRPGDIFGECRARNYYQAVSVNEVEKT